LTSGIISEIAQAPTANLLTDCYFDRENLVRVFSIFY
jgi:hypothetical protein